MWPQITVMSSFALCIHYTVIVVINNIIRWQWFQRSLTPQWGARPLTSYDTIKAKFHYASHSRYCANRAQMHRVLHISSKSVHFRRSYSRTREHRWNAPRVIPMLGWSLASSRITRITLIRVGTYHFAANVTYLLFPVPVSFSSSLTARLFQIRSFTFSQKRTFWFRDLWPWPTNLT